MIQPPLDATTTAPVWFVAGLLVWFLFTFPGVIMRAYVAWKRSRKQSEGK